MVPLARPPDLGIACRVANSTACGRIGIAVWLNGTARSVDVVLLGRRVTLHRPGAPYWQGFVHVDPRRIGLPVVWSGDDPARYLVLRLTVRGTAGVRRGSFRVRLRPGWG